MNNVLEKERDEGWRNESHFVLLFMIHRYTRRIHMCMFINKARFNK